MHDWSHESRTSMCLRLLSYELLIVLVSLDERLLEQSSSRRSSCLVGRIIWLLHLREKSTSRMTGSCPAGNVKIASGPRYRSVKQSLLRFTERCVLKSAFQRTGLPEGLLCDPHATLSASQERQSKGGSSWLPSLRCNKIRKWKEIADVRGV